LYSHIDLDKISFVSNNQLKSVLSQVDATEAEIDEAVRINIDARQRSLRAAFFVLAGVALLAIVPARGLPGYEDDETINEPLPASNVQT
jgi:hypothetical protein